MKYNHGLNLILFEFKISILLQKRHSSNLMLLKVLNTRTGYCSLISG